MSLSDNLKPWGIIEKRLDLACQADLALAFYNPISRSRPWQLGRALEIVRQHRSPQTPVTLGRDIGRPGQTLRVVTLGELAPEMVDMRTMVLIGSSTTCVFARANGSQWVYTPRWYGDKPEK
jgi:cobalt-precorrin 5A hydrolase/precorrin-3B C17-methyltransferase